MLKPQISKVNSNVYLGQSPVSYFVESHLFARLDRRSSDQMSPSFHILTPLLLNTNYRTHWSLERFVVHNGFVELIYDFLPNSS